METLLARNLDALARWRQALGQRLGDLSQCLADHHLLDDSAIDLLEGLRQRLAADRLVLAFVAEFSRGKSELINAIFFADTGRRILPATPGRTTMCPVELGYEAGEPPMLALLPIDTRMQGASLDELRRKGEVWTRIRLDPSSPDRLAEALTEVMRTRAVTVKDARLLGFWNDDRPEDNPPMVGEGLVEVPSWRHAVINYPHPMLRRGLVVLDTPGLNAVGAEPELTLSLLPAAHAVLFIVAADAGVTRSDLAVWRNHLSSQATARFVAINKIDTLADPLLSPERVREQVEAQRQTTAQVLGVAPERVFPLSARQALAARIDGQRLLLEASRLPELETVLANDLLPRRHEALAQAVLDGVSDIEQRMGHRVSDLRRQEAEQMLELRSLRGKSAAKVPLLMQRVALDQQEFERCTTRLIALRSVHARMVRDAVSALTAEHLKAELAVMQGEAGNTWLALGARRAFTAMCQRLRDVVAAATRRGDEIHAMLGASFRQLNSDFGFALSLPALPPMERYMRDLDLLERNYSQYLGLSQALRLADPRFLEQFRRMLLSKLRVVFEAANATIEIWNRDVWLQIDGQLRERRQGFIKRRDSLEAIRSAADQLETRIAELEAADSLHRQLLARLQGLATEIREQAAQPPDPDGAALPSRPDGRQPPTLTLVVPRPPKANAA